MRPIRRIVQLLALGGLVYGLAYTAVGGARAKEEQLRQEAAAREARAAVRSARSHIRPLDTAIHDVPLPGEMKRRVLGLYNGLAPETDAEQNPIHLGAEPILNHLGLLVDLRDVNAPLPGEAEMARYRGVVVWLNGSRMRDPAAYLAWLGRQARGGRPVVLLDGLGPLSDPAGRPAPRQAVAQALEALGLEYLGNPTNDPHRIEIVDRDSAMVEFERRLPRRIERYEGYGLRDPAGKVYLRLRRTDVARSDSVAVAVTSRGAFVAPGFTMHESRLGTSYVKQWRINPFRLFAEALDLRATPRPDFTTLGGSRIYYSHIDGDGLPSITEVNRRDMCADFTRKEVLERYDLPVTASFVVAGIEPPPAGRGDRFRIEVARRIARLPNVEVGAHGFAHPMDWRARQQAICSYEVPGYRMSAEKEIAHAVSFINREINPPGKPTMIMLWTGWCNPAEDQLAIAYGLGIYNMNGGDPQMDGQFPSYLHLAPPMHRVGDLIQYFTSGPNDYILTEEWHEPYHRWANAIQTARSTGAPHRVLPINIYYHFYVVEKPAALAAMHRIMRWVLQQEVAPLWVSQYIDVVRDFADIRIAPGAGPDSWRVLNSGYCRTVRFDGLERHVDLHRSRGVIGYRRLRPERALYVHLDASHDHTITLTDRPQRDTPYVLRHSAYLERVELARDRVVVTMRGIGRKHLTLANMAPSSRFAVSAADRGGARLTGHAVSDSNGTLDWRGDINGDAVELTLVRRGER